MSLPEVMKRDAGDLEPREHELKTWPDPFYGVWCGKKCHEIRVSDRDYWAGDYLRLREYDPIASTYSGRIITARVTYITPGGQFGLPPNLCVMSIDVIYRGNYRGNTRG